MPENDKKKWIDIDLCEIEFNRSTRGIDPAFLLNTFPELADQEYPPKIYCCEEDEVHVVVFTNLSKKEIEDKLVEELQKKYNS